MEDQNNDAYKLRLIEHILKIEDRSMLVKLSAFMQKERLLVLNKDMEEQEKSASGKADSPKPEKAYELEEVRKKHANAYMPWTDKDDEYLVQLYCEKLTVEQLSVAFGRNEGAIKSRIAKLDLEEKYG